MRKSVEECALPSQMGKWWGHGDALVRKSISALGTVYSKIFEIEGETAKESPTTGVYPDKYWIEDKVGEIDGLTSISASDMEESIHGCGLLASDVHPRLMYASGWLKYIKAK